MMLVCLLGVASKGKEDEKNEWVMIEEGVVNAQVGWDIIMAAEERNEGVQMERWRG